MYRLLPWKWFGSILAGVVALAVYADDLAAMMGVVLPDSLVVRCLPLILVILLTTIFGSAGRFAPWRWIWCIFPFLNRVLFPDLNGVWLGSTRSNWPTIKKMFDAAQAHEGITQNELQLTAEQVDTMAVEIKASLFKVQITAGLSATDSHSRSIIVRPWKDLHDSIHLTYVYKQETGDLAITDVETHLGAADLVIEMDNFVKAEGIYWTRRHWKLGLNTAGRLDLRRIKAWRDKGKSLRQYAAEERKRMTGVG